MDEYPKCLIREDEEILIVADADEEIIARDDGWRFWSDEVKPAKKASKAE